MSPSAFGLLLRQRRRKAGLTQEELAACSGLSVRTISNLERGGSRPYRRTAETLAEALALDAPAAEAFLAQARSARMPDAGPDDPGAGPAMPSGTGGPASSIPQQLPSGLLVFTAREAEVKAMSTALDEAGAPAGALLVLAITGAPGVGKTSLALHWAHQVADRFPDGQLYVNMHGFGPSGAATSSGTAIRGFLDALDVPADRIPDDPAGQEALYRTVLAGKRVLIVADNVRDAAAVRPLLPGSSGCAVLVTSRDRLMGLAVADGAFIVPLEPFTNTEADELLIRRLGSERVRTEPKAAAALIEISSRLPLALSIAAALAAARPGRSLASLVSELSGHASPLEALDTGDPMTTAGAVISWSYRHLSAPLADVFRDLGVHPGPDVSVAAVASLSARPVAEAQTALRQLVDASLVAEQVPGRYTLHDLLRTFAVAQAGGAGDGRPQAIRRLLDHYLHTALAADRALNPAREPIRLDAPAPGAVPEAISDHDDAMTWFEIEHKVLVAAVSLAAAHGFVSHAWQLPWTLVDYFERRGYWSDWLETQRIALAAAQDQGDLLALAHASRGLGIACSRTGHDDDAYAHYAAALGPFRELGDAVGEARVHQDISWLLDRQGRPAEALPHDETALRLYQEAGRLSGQANALNAIGWLNAELGNYRTTLEYCRRALELQRELGNLRGQAAALDSLGYAHFRLGEYAKAMSRYQQSLQAFRQLADRPYQAEVLIHLGDVRAAAGDRTAALDAWRLAFVILSNLRHPDADAVRTRIQDHGSAVPDVGQDCR